MTDPRLQRGETSRERRIPEEMMIARMMPKDDKPLAFYNMGAGCFYEWRTLKIVWPWLKVFGCEPCPDAYKELVPLYTGVLLNIAVGAEAGKQDLYLTHQDQAGSTLKPAPSELSRAKVTVDVWTLDQFDEWAGKPKDVLLWMDIEGSELDALRGGTRLLESGRVRWINLETRDKCPDDCLKGHPTTAQINAFLVQYDFVPVHRYNVQGDYPEAAGDMIYFKRGSVPVLACNWGVLDPYP